MTVAEYEYQRVCNERDEERRGRISLTIKLNTAEAEVRRLRGLVASDAAPGEKLELRRLKAENAQIHSQLHRLVNA